MRFGIFIAPFHDYTSNPNAALYRDLDLIAHLDRLGFDEAWVGEHHSCGTEIVGDPMLFCATALERTRTIKLGTGVVSVPYHNPLWTADRIVQLDHLSRGRFMFGAGPGALPTDAQMIGIQTSEQRRMLEEGMEAIMHLLRRDEPLTMKADWFDLVDAKCQLPLYSEELDIVVAAIQSPSGPRLAGRHGVGMLSIGATLHNGDDGVDMLGLHFNVWDELARENGYAADRRKWRLVGLMHCAETKEQALRDVEFGIDAFFEYLQSTSATPHLVPEGETVQERIEWINESGIGAIGTPEDCLAQITKLWEQSGGGFGSYLCMHHDFANPAATNRSYELMAQYVFPHFQNNAYARLKDATDRAKVIRDALMTEQQKALQAWTDKHARERAERAAETTT